MSKPSCPLDVPTPSPLRSEVQMRAFPTSFSQNPGPQWPVTLVPSTFTTIHLPPPAMSDSNLLLQQCVTQLMGEGQCADCAVVGLRSGEVLAAAEGGVLQYLSRRELRLLLASNRERLQTQGLSLGGMPLTLLRDQLTTAGGAGGAHAQRSMDLRTKQRPSQGVAVCRTRTHLLLLMGRHGVGSGLLNHRAHQMAACLRNAGA
ncbi:hypothetical protein ACEWY4_004379 [Coilia grayii]|uniref:Profilin n=1 Tax=Coilia grayii TaxID=363190 RepID=A0ABD1KLB9_9TELE